MEFATPTLQSVFKYLTTTDPTLLGFEALGIWILYVSAGPAFNLIADIARGYAGDTSPPAALDAIVANGNAYLIDIRSQVGQSPHCFLLFHKSQIDTLP